MNKKIIPFFAMALAAVTLTACGGTTGTIKYEAENPTTTYSWDRNHDGTLGYLMMIGDKGHNDSLARTEGAEKALVGLGKELNVTINELANKEMKNNSGATWDATTAGDTMGTWLSQYGDKIDVVVSNNDGMASAAYANSNWPKGLPIFGFDALPSAAKDIVDGKLAGSITQNGDAQARAIAQLLRNYADGVENPLTTGISVADGVGNKVERCTVDYDEAEKKLLVPCGIVTEDNSSEYLSGSFEEITENKGSKTLNVLVTVYNQGDNFLKEVYVPAFKHYGEALGINFTFVEGDGSQEGSCLDRFTNLDQYDAYVINMVKTDSGSLYTEKLKGANADKPVIFYNRQPMVNGEVDQATMSFNDKTHYVGVNTEGSGDLQGQMIAQWLKDHK